MLCPFVMMLAATLTLALAFHLIASARGRRAIEVLDAIMRRYACPLPVAMFHLVILVEYFFDLWFLNDRYPPRVRTLFHRVDPANDSASATREASARLVLEMLTVSLAVATVVSSRFSRQSLP